MLAEMQKQHTVQQNVWKCYVSNSGEKTDLELKKQKSLI